MSDVIARTLALMPYQKECSLDDYFAIDAEARVRAAELLHS
jgi:hypothetical protein